MKTLSHNILNWFVRRKVELFFLLFLPLFLPQIIFAQYADLKFKNFSRDDGLSTSGISSVLQDRDGFIWFGTNSGGVNRYDGYNFKIYGNVTCRSGSFDYSWIRSLYEDENGMLWIGTWSEGLSKFDKNTEKFSNYYNNPYDLNTIGGNTVHSIYMDDSGYLWIGFEDYGLDKFDEKNNRFIHYRNNVSDTNSICGETVWTIYEDRSNNLWIGTDKGLEQFDRKDGIFYHYKNFSGNIENEHNNVIQCIYEDNAGVLWLGTEYGLNKVKYINQKIHFYKTYYFTDKKSGNNISSIYQDSKGLFWIGTFGEGLFIFDPITEKFTNNRSNESNPESMINDRIERYSIIEDKSGNIWIGTSFGVSMYRRNNFNFYPFKEGVASLAVFEDKKDNVWITGNNNFHIRDKNGIFNIVNYEFPGNQNSASGWLYSGTCDKQGTIWLGYRSGLYKFSLETKKLDLFYTFLDENNLPSPAVHAIFEDSDSLLWICTSKGVWMFDKDRTEARKFVHSSNDSNSLGSDYTYVHIYEDKSGGIWFTLWHNGVDKYDKETDRFYHYKNNPADSNSISSNLVCSLCDDGMGSMWIVACAGLDRLNLSTNTFTHFTEKNGLADSYTVFAIPDTSGNLWVATNSGISKFNPNTQTFRNYDKNDGLQGVEFMNYAYKSRKGEMFFVGVNGLTYFFPDSIKENLNIPPVFITSFKVFEREAELEKSILKTDEIKLSHKDNFFSFEFAALDYTNPKKNQYAYKLEGVDKDWVYTKNVRTAHYTNIDPGEYIFRVKASNNDGVWNEEGTSIRIIITPPWWQTWWFRGCGILFILAALEFSRERHMKKVRREIRQKEEFSRQLISGQEQERKRIASDLHDSHAQNLLVLKNRVSLLMRRKDTASTSKEELRDISDGLLHSMDEIRSITYSLRPHEIERFGLTDSLVQMIEKVGEACIIIFKTQIENINGLLKQDDEVILYRIVQECLNNIVKHSGAKTALIKIAKLPDSINIQIKDDGRGFDPERLSQQNKHSLGMRDIRERINLLKGRIDIITSKGKGTSIQLNIPYTTFSNEQET